MMTTPNYQKNDPHGWCGDMKRGAAMGRHSFHEPNFQGKLYLRKVRLNQGGYDVNGTYFGGGPPMLYWCASADCEVDFTLRANGRLDARQQVLERYPGAQVRR